MSYSFINIHTKSKIVLETDKYFIRRRIKSKLSYSDNYLEIKEIPTTELEIDYYISACRNYFRDNGVNFVHLALPENKQLSKKIVKYLTKQNYNEIIFSLYVLNVQDYELVVEKNIHIGELEKQDYDQYMKLTYKIDLELANLEWAEHNKNSHYENIRNDDIVQLVVKDNGNIVASVNLIMDDDYLEIDSLYVVEKYRRRGIATQLIDYIINNYNKKQIILVADSEDTPKYLYEGIGFKEVGEKRYYLKTTV